MSRILQSQRRCRRIRRANFGARLRPTIEWLEDRLAPATLPNGFTESVVASGMASPTAMEIAPDGRIFVTEQGGQLRVIENGNLLAQPFVTLNVDDFFERGLLGVAFDPNFATNQFVYVYYTTGSNPIHNRVSRFTANGNMAIAGSESVMLDLPNLSAGNHNGGAIHFGLDGKLFIGVGENAVPSNSQSLNTRLGKMLRINPDGTIPNDNPFFNTTTGNNRAIWALGLRNPFTFAVQPGTGRIFINDVGQDASEEINDGIAGSNYGWPNSEGLRKGNDPPTSIGTYRDPLLAYAHGNSNTTGCAIAGGAFYDPTVDQFPSDYTGDYFFADLCSAWIRKYDPASDTVTGFATDLPEAPVDLKVDSAGNLYYLTRGSGSSTGQVTRVQFLTNQAPSITQHPGNQLVTVGQQAMFSVSASGSPPLSFQWQRDGVDIPSATSATITIENTTLADSGARFRVVVINAAGSATSNEATLTVVDNQLPTATINTPVDIAMYNAGDAIDFSGTGTDPEDGNLPASAFTWRVDFHHADHVHPHVPPFSGFSASSFFIPDGGEKSTDVFYRIILTVRDSFGFTSTTTRDVRPRTSNFTVETVPAGLQLRLDDQPVATPFTTQSVIGMRWGLGVVSPQIFDGSCYRFASWSDAGESRHGIVTAAQDTTYTATFAMRCEPQVTDLRLLAPKRGPRQIVVTLLNPLDPAAATDLANYSLVAPGKDKRFDVFTRPSRDDRPLRLGASTHQEAVDPASGFVIATVTIPVISGLNANSFYRFVIDGTSTAASPGALVGANGVALDGEFAMIRGFPSGGGTAGGDFDAIIGHGRRFNYFDGSGDKVTLELSGSGRMEIVRQGPESNGDSSDAVTLRLLETTESSFLSGRIRSLGTGAAFFHSVFGLTGVRNNIQSNPYFIIVGQVAAQVVDRVLDSNPTANGRLDDLFDDLLRGRD